jgi:hypothetical protein
MPISKKDRIHREHKKAEAAGTRIPVNPNGTPVKPKKATSICVFCKKEIVSLDYAQKTLKVTSVLRVDGSNFRAPEQPMNRRYSADTTFQTSSNLAVLEQHAGTHPDVWTKEKCWPNDFK